MFSNFRSKLLSTAVALSTSLLLFGCGGGGGGGDDTPNMVTVSPSLGKFSKDTKVSLKKADGSLIKDGPIGDNGTASIDVGSYTGPLVVEVEGGANVKYYDEGKDALVAFPAGRKLKAVAAAVTLTIGVTPFTHAAAEKMGNNLSEANIRKENTQIAQQFGLVDILTPPVVVGSGDKVESADGDAGKYALLLAGFAKAADTAGFGLLEALDALATDLKDGKLDAKNGEAPVNNALSAAGIKFELTNAANDFAKADDKAFLAEQLDEIVIATDTPQLTQEELDAIAAAGSDLDKAKKFFSDLRGGILPYANKAETGFLDNQGRNLQDEVDALTENTVDGLQGTVELGAEVWDYLEGTSNDCTANSATTATCSIYFGRGIELPVTISNNMATQVITYTINANATGTIAYTMNGNTVTGITINGIVPGMTLNTRSTVENLAVTRTARGNDMYRYTLSGKMTDKLIVGGASVLSLQLDNSTMVDTHEPADINDENDLSKFVFDVTGIYTTANYSFKGRFQVSNLVEKEYIEQFCWFNGMQWQSCDEYELVSGNATFTGTISGIGLVDTDANNNFDILVGKLEAIMKDENNYDPALSDSSTNFLTGSMTFTGTTFMTATDTGLKIVLGVTATGHEKGTVSVNYSDFKKGISITGTTNWDDAITTPQTITLTDANGIKIVLVEDVDNAEVKKGDVKLADIAGSMINYVDGTSASLF